MEAISETDLKLHERVTTLEAHSERAYETIKELAAENKKSAEQTQRQGFQLEQLTLQVKRQGKQWDNSMKEMTANWETLGKRVTKYAIIGIAVIVVGILFNSPEKVLPLIKNSLPF